MYKELQEIQDRCKRYYTPLGAEWKASEDRWLFPSGASIELGFCERTEDVGRYQGREWTYIGFDELGNLKDEEPWELLQAEVRSPDPSLIPMARGTGNPGGKGHAWVKRRIIVPTNYGSKVHNRVMDVPGIGRVTKTVRFIPARVTDNPIYAKDARYMAALYALPVARRKQLLFGDWDAAEGMALDELTRDKHWVPQPVVPDHWYVWCAFDWGYAHPWAFGIAAMDSRGNAYLLDSVHGWRQKPHEIVARIEEHAETLFPGRGTKRYQKIVAGRDCFYEMKARGEDTPRIAEHFEKASMPMYPANVSRVFGLMNLNQYFAWRGVARDSNGRLIDGDPMFVLCDTPGNRQTWSCLESMVRDPRQVEDALKVDADPRTGLGGDDPYDMVRYLMADRPYVPREPKAKKTDQELFNVDPMNEVFDQMVHPTNPSVGHGAWDQFGGNF